MLKQQLAQASLAGASGTNSAGGTAVPTRPGSASSPAEVASPSGGDARSSSPTTATAAKRESSSAPAGAFVVTAAVLDGTIEGNNIPEGKGAPSNAVMIATSGEMSMAAGSDEGGGLGGRGANKSHENDGEMRLGAEAGPGAGRSNLTSPDVVIQEKIVERVVVEEKVRHLSV